MAKKTSPARLKMIEARYQDIRSQCWPELDDSQLWYRKEKAGFVTIPRALPYFHVIMNSMSKGKPVSSTYFGLWCRVFDQSIIIIENPEKMAFEAGYTGQRAVVTWKERMRILMDLGFIDAKPGASGDYNYVLLFNPYLVVKRLYENKQLPEEREYFALFDRATEIGAANDLK